MYMNLIYTYKNEKSMGICTQDYSNLTLIKMNKEHLEVMHGLFGFQIIFLSPLWYTSCYKMNT
jgi:hypothetical protein